MPSLYESAEVVIVLAHQHDLAEEFFDACDVEVFDGMVLAVDHEGKTIQAVLDDLLAGLQHLYEDVLEHVLSDSRSQLNHIEDVRPPDQLRDQVLADLDPGLDEEALIHGANCKVEVQFCVCLHCTRNTDYNITVKILV